MQIALQDGLFPGFGGPGLADLLRLADLLGLAGADMFSFFLGAACASFTLACGMRLAAGEPVIWPRSRCRNCGRIISWWALLPVIGWGLARGRCQNCRDRLPLSYLLAELGGGLLFVLLARQIPASHLPFVWILAFMGLSVLFSDALALLIWMPALLLAGGAALLAGGLQLAGILPGWPVSLAEMLAGAGICAGLPLAAGLAYQKWRGQPGLGSGDIWLAGVIGLWLGPLGGLAVFCLAATGGALWAGLLLLLGRAGRQTPLPFGLYLSVVVLCVLLVYS